MINFLCLFALQTALKKITNIKSEKVNIGPYGNFLLVNLLRKKLKSEVLHFKKFFATLIFWNGLPVFTQQSIYLVESETKQSIDHIGKCLLVTLLWE